MKYPSFRALIEHRGVFGCAALHRTHSHRERHRLLAAAYEAGFRRFDVAPAYGNGLAERALGDVFGATRTDVFVRTKTGIPVAIYPSAFDVAFPIARAADMCMGNHRKAYANRVFDAETMARELAGSTARLRGIVPETLFLHDPLKPLAPNAWFAARASLERVAWLAGIASFGVAGANALESVASAAGGLAIQIPFARWGLASANSPTVASSRVSVFGLHATYLASCDRRPFEAWLIETSTRHAHLELVITTRSVARLRAWGGA